MAKPRKKTRSGKAIDTATGKVAIPLVKRGEKGRAVPMTDADRAAAVRTELPTAGREVMAPKKTSQPVHIPGTLRRGGERKTKGFAVNFPVAQKAVSAALYHLNNAHFAKGAGLNPEPHFQAFDAIHKNIQGMDKQLHLSLGAARHLINTGNGEMTPELRQTHANIRRRLNEGQEHHEENLRRTMTGLERKGNQ